MSKERLEEIKRQLEESNSYDDNPNGYWYRNINWLIEQAERVEVLERENKALNNILTTLEKQDKIKLLDQNVRLIKQNKRYREALEFIGNHANESELMDNTMYTELVKEIIEKALEESN